MRIFCFSGLGVDKRAFQFLQLDEFDLVHVPWITNSPEESLVEYAKRISAPLDITEEDCLMGVSFGGMIIQEIAKLFPVADLILISTIEKKENLKRSFKFAAAMNGFKIMPDRAITKTNRAAYTFFGVEKASHKKLLDEIFADTDPDFVRWALKAISRWQNDSHPEALRIHGTKIVCYQTDSMMLFSYLMQGTLLSLLMQRKFPS